MKMLFNQDSYVKKGRAMFAPSNDHTGISTGTAIKMFGGLKDIKSDNVVFLSETQILLKKGFTFKFMLGMHGNNFSDTSLGIGAIKLNFINPTNPSGLLGKTRLYVAPVTATSGSFKPFLVDEYTAIEDTVLEVKCQVSVGTFSIYTASGDSFLYVEELEAYLTPIPRIDFDETVIKQASQNISIVPNLPVGYEKVIRKDFATQGVCTISFSDTNEKFTTANLSSLDLNYDGDYIRIKKITSTRWDIIGEFRKRNWQDVSASRTTNGSYTNTTGRDIEVSIWINSVSTTIYNLTVNGVAHLFTGSTNGQANICISIPNGATYSCNGTNFKWLELR